MLLCEISLRLEFLLRDWRGHRESYSMVHSIFLKEAFLPKNYFGGICVVGFPFLFRCRRFGKITWDSVAQKNNRSTDYKTVTFVVGRVLLWDG